MIRRTMMVMAAMAAALAPAVAIAQAQQCSVPSRIETPLPALPSKNEPRRVLPIGGYTLALTWSPGFCRAHGNAPQNAFQCHAGNRFGFTLHGLWPDGEGRLWPQYCAATGIVPPPVIRKTLCATPSVQLIQHEWAKHGTCADMDMEGYFAKARSLYQALRFPDMAALSRRSGLTVGMFQRAFAASNPDVPADAVRVKVTRSGWLDELWLCMDTRYRYAACGADSDGAPDYTPLRIWRGEY